MSTSLYDYCAEYDRLALLREWHPTKNGPLTPENVTYGSKKKVWWQCERSHIWQAAVYARTGRSSGCPYCAGQKPYPGENDLASQRPDLAAQWHPTKNRGVTPADVVTGSHHMAWWICDKGHEWRAMVKSRASGCGCPVCASRVLLPGVNDLATTHPELAAQWHPTKNGALTAKQVSPSSNRKVWWRCQLGHAYQASVGARTVNGSGCPYCAGKKVLAGFNDLATLEPRIAAQWHPTLNGTLSPEMVTVGSRRKAWWQCPSGHVWKAVIYSRTGPQKCGCPYCAGKVKPDRRSRYRPVMAQNSIPMGQDAPRQNDNIGGTST